MCVMRACASEFKYRCRPEMLGAPGAGVPGSCRLPDMADGSQTGVLFKSTVCSELLSGPSRPTYQAALLLTVTRYGNENEK